MGLCDALTARYDSLFLYACRDEAAYHPYVFQVLRPVLEKSAQGEIWHCTGEIRGGKMLTQR